MVGFSSSNPLILRARRYFTSPQRLKKTLASTLSLRRLGPENNLRPIAANGSLTR